MLIFLDFSSFLSCANFLVLHLQLWIFALSRLPTDAHCALQFAEDSATQMPNQRGFWNWFLRGTPALSMTEQSGMAASALPAGSRDRQQGNAISASQFVPLESVVEQFNLLASEDKVGRDQLPLTVDEVVTAIRSAGRHQLPLSESHRRLLQSIAETQRVPADAQLKFTTSWVALSGYRCEVWWIDLVMPAQVTGTDPRQASASSLRIRDHRLRSWHDPSITIPTEIQRLQSDHRWFPASSVEIEEPAHQ